MFLLLPWIQFLGCIWKSLIPLADQPECPVQGSILFFSAIAILLPLQKHYRTDVSTNEKKAITESNITSGLLSCNFKLKRAAPEFLHFKLSLYYCSVCLLQEKKLLQIQCLCPTMHTDCAHHGVVFLKLNIYEQMICKC